MTHEEFVELVAKMRDKQNTYFRTKSRIALDESKALEKAVDAAIYDFRFGGVLL